MRKTKNALSIAVIFALTGMLTACSTTNGGAANTQPAASVQDTSAGKEGGMAGDTIKVAAFYNLSGSGADSGLRCKEGTDLAVERINAAGGIKTMGGKKIEIVYGDTLSDVSQVKAVTERVLSDSSIVASVGVGGSAYATPALPIMEKLQKPYILFGTAANLTEQGYQYLFRTVPYGGDNGSFGKIQVEFLQWLRDNRGIQADKVGIIYENSDYGISVAASNKALAEKAGFEIVYEESYPAGLSDASSLVVGLKSSGAEAIFPAMFTQEAKLIFNTMKSMNYNPVIVGGGAGFLMPEFATALGDDIDGVTSVASMNWNSKNVVDNSELVEITTAYEEKYGIFMCEHAVSAYNNLIILADALERADSTDGPVLMEAIRAADVATFQARGNVKFDEVGNNVNAYPVIVQWQKTESGDYKPISVFPEDMANGEFQSE